jgi:predicted TIM-barrel fold metal-dependent hydrolase
MLIADAQVHLWKTDPPDRPLRHGARPFEFADLVSEMRAAGVDRAVVIPPFWEGPYNGTALEAAQLYPDRFRVMGRFEVSGESNPAAVGTWREQPGMAGIRLTFHTPELIRDLADDALDWFWTAAEKANLPLMIYAPGALATLRKIALRHPSLRIAIDHMGIDRGDTDDAAFAHIEELCALGALPNMAVKLTTVPIYSSEPYPHPKLHPYLKRLYDAYGPKRLFWGSDLTRLPCSYRVCVDLFRNELKWLSVSDLEWIMGRALCDWLGWPLPGDARHADR